MAEDDLDIYDDLLEFQQTEEKKSKEFEELENKYKEVQKENDVLRLENKSLCKKIKTIEINFQNLLDTAKAELKRHEKIIAELRKEKDDICFRRKRPNFGNLRDNQSMISQLGQMGTDEVSSSDVLPAMPPPDQAVSYIKSESRNTEKYAQRIQDKVNNSNLLDQRFAMSAGNSEKTSAFKRGNDELRGQRENYRVRKDEEKRRGKVDLSRDRDDRYARENKDWHVGSRSRADNERHSRYGRCATEDRYWPGGAVRNKVQRDGDAFKDSTMGDRNMHDISRIKTVERGTLEGNEHHHVRKSRDERVDRNRRDSRSCKRGRSYEEDSSNQNKRKVRKCTESSDGAEGNSIDVRSQHQTECKENLRASAHKKNASSVETMSTPVDPFETQFRVSKSGVAEETKSPKVPTFKKIPTPNLFKTPNLNEEVTIKEPNQECYTIENKSTDAGNSKEETETQEKLSPNSVLIYNIIKEITTKHDAIRDQTNEEYEHNETDVNSNVTDNNFPLLSTPDMNGLFHELFGQTPPNAEECSPNVLENVMNILENNNDTKWTPESEYTPQKNTTESSNLTNHQSDQKSVDNYFTPNALISIDSNHRDIDSDAVPNIPDLDLVNKEQLPVSKEDRESCVSDTEPNKTLYTKDKTADLNVSRISDDTSVVEAAVRKVGGVVKISDALKEAISQTLMEPVDHTEMLIIEDTLLNEYASRELCQQVTSETSKSLIVDSEVVVHSCNVEEQRSATQNEEFSKDLIGDETLKSTFNDGNEKESINGRDSSNKLKCKATTNKIMDSLSDDYESITDESSGESSNKEEKQNEKSSKELCEHNVTSETSESLIKECDVIKDGNVEAEWADALQNKDNSKDLYQHLYIESNKSKSSKEDEDLLIIYEIVEKESENNEQIDFTESGIDSGYSQESLQKEILDFQEIEENPCTDGEVVNYTSTGCELQVKEKEESPAKGSNLEAICEKQTEEAFVNVTRQECHQINQDLCSSQTLDKSKIEIIQNIRLPDVYAMHDDASTNTSKLEQQEQTTIESKNIADGDEDPVINVTTKQQLDISEVPSKELMNTEVCKLITMPDISNDAIELALSALHDPMSLSPNKPYSSLDQAEIKIKANAKDQQPENNLTDSLNNDESMIATSTNTTEVKEDHVQDLLDILNDSVASNRSESETDCTMSKANETFMNSREQTTKVEILTNETIKQNKIRNIENTQSKINRFEYININSQMQKNKIPKFKKTNDNLTVLDCDSNKQITKEKCINSMQPDLTQPSKDTNKSLKDVSQVRISRESTGFVFADKNEESFKNSDKTLLHQNDTIIPEKRADCSESEHATQVKLLQCGTEMEHDVPTKNNDDSRLDETLELSELATAKRFKLDSSIELQQCVIEMKSNELNTNDTQLSLPKERRDSLISSPSTSTSLLPLSNTQNTSTADVCLCDDTNSSKVSICESDVSSVTNTSPNNSSSLNVSPGSGSVVTKLITLGSSDYRFEKTENNRIKLYVTRHKRNRRVLNETTVTPTSSTCTANTYNIPSLPVTTALSTTTSLFDTSSTKSTTIAKYETSSKSPCSSKKSLSSTITGSSATLSAFASFSSSSPPKQNIPQ